MSDRVAAELEAERALVEHWKHVAGKRADELDHARSSCEHWRKDYTDLQATLAKVRADLDAMTADMLAVQSQRNEWRECWGSVDVENGELKAEIRRLSGCLWVIAGAEGCGNGSLRTASAEAACGASVADLIGKLGSPVPPFPKPPGG